jgi:hypothetical protein
MAMFELLSTLKLIDLTSQSYKHSLGASPFLG